MVADLCSVCRQFEQRVATGSVGDPSGGVAQLVERLHGMQEVRGFESHRLHALRGQAATERDAFAGSVAGESSIVRASRLGQRRPQVALRLPSPLHALPCRQLPATYGLLHHQQRPEGSFGPIISGGADVASFVGGRLGKGPSGCSEFGCDRPVRGRRLCRSHYYRATGYDVDSFVGGFVAAATAVLAWRTALLEYWEHHAKRVRPCTIEGCERSRRAKGLCRSHYYDAYRR